MILLYRYIDIDMDRHIDRHIYITLFVSLVRLRLRTARAWPPPSVGPTVLCATRRPRELSTSRTHLSSRFAYIYSVYRSFIHKYIDTYIDRCIYLRSCICISLNKYIYIYMSSLRLPSFSSRCESG